MSPVTLPYELLLSVTESLSLSDINALVQTNTWLYNYLNDQLYYLDAKAGGSALIWAAKHGARQTARLSLDAETDIGALHMMKTPRQLKCLRIVSPMISLTSLQIALCYKSESVARLLIERGATSTNTINGCTDLHIASAMSLTAVVKLLIEHGANVEAQDTLLRTPLHLAVSIQRSEWPEQGRTAMWLLAKNANPEVLDVNERRPSSYAKHSPNPFLKMLFKKGAKITQYECLFQDQDTSDIERLEKERAYEEARETRRIAKQRERELAIRLANKRAREQEELARKRAAQAGALYISREDMDKFEVSQFKSKEERAVERAREEKQSGIRKGWSDMRKTADQRSQEPEGCKHLSGWWKANGLQACQSCGLSAQSPILCPDCGFVKCLKCNSGTM